MKADSLIKDYVEDLIEQKAERERSIYYREQATLEDREKIAQLEIAIEKLGHFLCL